MYSWFTHAHTVISLERRHTHSIQVEPWAILNCPECDYMYSIGVQVIILITMTYSQWLIKLSSVSLPLVMLSPLEELHTYSHLSMATYWHSSKVKVYGSCMPGSWQPLQWIASRWNEVCGSVSYPRPYCIICGNGNKKQLRYYLWRQTSVRIALLTLAKPQQLEKSKWHSPNLRPR